MEVESQKGVTKMFFFLCVSRNSITFMRNNYVRLNFSVRFYNARSYKLSITYLVKGRHLNDAGGFHDDKQKEE